MIHKLDIDDNVIGVYKSKADAARSIDVDESTVRKSIKYGRIIKKKYKFTDTNRIQNASPIVHKGAKILFLDIETAPLRAYSWGLWNQNIYLDQIISNFFIISWAAKWQHEEEAFGLVLTPNEILKENDKNILIPLHELLDEADIVVAHYGDKFDIPKINSRFVVHGLTPPSPYKQIDTKKIAKGVFGFSSNKLEALARQFGFEGKYDTDMKLWVDCMKGDVIALFKMLAYNEQDVIVLEKVYLKLRPYAKGHPNLDLYTDEDYPACPNCGSASINIVPNKYFYTQAVRYKIYRCDDCGALSREKKGTAYNNKKQVSAIPR